jgi:hypothetical protein
MSIEAQTVLSPCTKNAKENERCEELWRKENQYVSKFIKIFLFFVVVDDVERKRKLC